MVIYLGSLVQSCCGERGTLQTNITGLYGECLHCLSHSVFAPTHSVCAFPVYTAQALVCSARNCLRWALVCMHFPSLSHSGHVLKYTTKAQTQLGLHFVPFLGLSSSGNQVLEEHTLLRCSASYHLPCPSHSVSPVHHLRCSMCLFWGAALWLQPSQWMSSIQDPRKTWLATGSLLTLWWRMPSLELSLPLSGSGCCLPASLPLKGNGPVGCWLALLWYLLSPLFCEQARQCLTLGLFAGKFSLFSLSLAIPQFGLLLHVSSLRLSSGHSVTVLTLSNAARTSLFSPRLLVADVSVWATSLLGIAIRHAICGFYLFIFPPSCVAL